MDDKKAEMLSALSDLQAAGKRLTLAVSNTEHANKDVEYCWVDSIFYPEKLRFLKDCKLIKKVVR